MIENNFFTPTHRFLSPAKLNLDLRIIGQRSDGYHLLESVFTLVNLCDTVDVALRSDDNIILHTPADHRLPATQDLAYRAAKLMQQLTGRCIGVDLAIEKRIPMGGGLGGGSSNAATVMLALNQLLGCHLSTKTLMKHGLSLGADVPFFLYGKNVFVQGIGEILSEINVIEQLYLIVHPRVHIATAKIFAHKNLTRNSPSCIMQRFTGKETCRNDMQPLVLSEYPEVARAFECLSPFGAPMLTGSGSCIFVTFNKSQQQEAKAAYQAVSRDYPAFLVEGLARHPMLAYD